MHVASQTGVGLAKRGRYDERAHLLLTTNQWDVDVAMVRGSGARQATLHGCQSAQRERSRPGLTNAEFNQSSAATQPNSRGGGFQRQRAASGGTEKFGRTVSLSPTSCLSDLKAASDVTTRRLQPCNLQNRKVECQLGRTPTPSFWSHRLSHASERTNRSTRETNHAVFLDVSMCAKPAALMVRVLLQSRPGHHHVEWYQYQLVA